LMETRWSGRVTLLLHGLQVGGDASRLAPSLVLVLALDRGPVVGVKENDFLGPTFG